ncbi:MAG: protein serine/threonine phosphatase [Acidimicrobiia bacterium]|nr:protein serine/threonine phosphatase [Acidimicrobiia bacterium]
MDFSVLATMLAESHVLRPDEMPQFVQRWAVAAGLTGAEIYLIDRQQRVLRRWHGAEDTGGEVVDTVLAVDATLAGRTFRTQQSQVVASGTETTIWFPLLDGADRLGVLALGIPESSTEDLSVLEAFTSLVAELVVSKSGYGDGVELARRRMPMELAAEMRWAVLPPLTFVCPSLSIAGALEPAYVIAGDCFDYAVNGDVLHFAIFDAVGHGLTASCLATLAVTAYRSARRRHLGLTETYECIDSAVREEFGDSHFATAQLGQLELRSGHLRWINAGHPPPLLLRQGHHRTLSCTPCLPVGLRSLGLLATIPVEETVLEPHDRLVFYSDGITEATDAEGQQFGAARLADFSVRASASGEHLPETVRRLMNAILEYQRHPPADDATVLVIEWTDRQRPSL